MFWVIIGKMLTKTDYGIITTSVNAALILSAISMLGLGMAITKLLPEYLQKRNRLMAKALTKFSFKVLLASNVIIFILLSFFSSFISSLLKITQMHVLLIAVSTVALSLSSFTTSVLRGIQYMKKIMLTDLIAYAVKASGTFLLLFVFLQNIIPLFIFAFTYFLLFLIQLDLRWIFSKTSVIDYRQIISNYALPTFVATIAWLTFTNAQFIILTAIKDPAVTGIFSVAAIATTLIAVIPSVITSAFFPIMSQLSVSSVFKRQQKYFLTIVLRYILFVSIPLALLFSIFPSKVVIAFAKSEFLGSIELFPVLSFSAILNGIGMLFLSNLYALRKIKLYRNIIVLTAISFLSLSIPMTSLFSSFGLAVAYAISMLLMFSSSFYFLRKIIRISIPINNVAKMTVASLISLSVFYFMTFISVNNLLQILFLVVSALLYPVILLLLKFYIKEDIRVLEFVEKNSPKFVANIFGRIIAFLTRFVK